MPDEKKEDKALSIDEIVGQVSKAVEEKIGGVRNALDATNEKLDSWATKKAPKEPDEDFKFVGEDDDGEFVTKKDLKNFAKVVVDKTAELAKSTSAKMTNEVITEKQVKVARDVAALSAFPMMDSRNTEKYQEDFLKDVDTEMNQRIDRGRNRNDPDLLYDAAAAIHAKWVNSGKLVPDHMVKEESRKMNNNDDDFDIRGGGRGPSGKPNEYQIGLAAQFGMSKERLTQLIERNKKI